MGTCDAVAEFDEWIKAKLVDLNADPDILGSYITSIVTDSTDDDADSLDEKIDAIEGIISTAIESDVSQLTKAILDKWEELKLRAKHKEEESKLENPGENVEDRLVSIIGNSLHLSTKCQQNGAAKTPASVKDVTDEEKEYRQSIIAAYGAEEEDGEDGPNSHGAISSQSNGQSLQASRGKTQSNGCSGDPLMARNTNAETIAAAERSKREAQKVESEKKKQQDKLNREKQKQQVLDRKDREKNRTQKGERQRR